jgi:UDP-N-acetylmuramate dehydrogenase
MADKEVIELLKTDITGARMKFDEPMAKHTSLHLGGPADIFVTPRDSESLALALKVLNRHGLPPLPLGGGTNLLVRDGGIEGAVVSLSELRGLSVTREDAETVVLHVGAGLSLQELVGYANRAGLSGIEGLAGIPGQVGGAIAGNAGAYGCEMKDVLLKISILDGEDAVRTMGRDEVSFGYRRAGLPEGAVVLGAELALKKDDPEAVAGRDREFLKDKKARQPLGQRSAGCVFKNPETGPAGKLIDEAGCKGLAVGDIEVSSVHANFFINRGQGMAGDFLGLMDIVAGRVMNIFGVALEPEIKVVGR